MQKVDSGLPVRTLESSGSTALILTGGVLSPTPALCEMASTGEPKFCAENPEALIRGVVMVR